MKKALPILTLVSIVFCLFLLAQAWAENNPTPSSSTPLPVGVDTSDTGYIIASSNPQLFGDPIAGQRWMDVKIASGEVWFYTSGTATTTGCDIGVCFPLTATSTNPPYRFDLASGVHLAYIGSEPSAVYYIRGGRSLR